MPLLSCGLEDRVDGRHHLVPGHDALEQRGQLATDQGDHGRYGLQLQGLHDAGGRVDVQSTEQELAAVLGGDRGEVVGQLLTGRDPR